MRVGDRYARLLSGALDPTRSEACGEDAPFRVLR